MTQTIKLAVIPGDGIGKEVVPEGLKVLERALEGTGITVRPTTFDLGRALAPHRPDPHR